MKLACHSPFPLAQSVGMSSISGEGVDKFFDLLGEARVEFVK